MFRLLKQIKKDYKTKLMLTQMTLYRELEEKLREKEEQIRLKEETILEVQEHLGTARDARRIAEGKVDELTEMMSELSAQLQEAKQSLQDNRMKYIQDLIDSLVL